MIGIRSAGSLKQLNCRTGAGQQERKLDQCCVGQRMKHSATLKRASSLQHKTLGKVVSAATRQEDSANPGEQKPKIYD